VFCILVCGGIAFSFYKNELGVSYWITLLQIVDAANRLFLGNTVNEDTVDLRRLFLVILVAFADNLLTILASLYNLTWFQRIIPVLMMIILPCSIMVHILQDMKFDLQEGTLLLILMTELMLVLGVKIFSLTDFSKE